MNDLCEVKLWTSCCCGGGMRPPLRCMASTAFLRASCATLAVSTTPHHQPMRRAIVVLCSFIEPE